MTAKETAMRIVEIKRRPVDRSPRTGRAQPSVVYVWVQGETLAQNLENRRCRPYTAYKQMLAPHLEALGIPAGAKLAWNQRAGCSCPCSPGFNVRAKNAYGDGTYAGYITHEGAPVDVHVTITMDPEPCGDGI